MEDVVYFDVSFSLAGFIPRIVGVKSQICFFVSPADEDKQKAPLLPYTGQNCIHQVVIEESRSRSTKSSMEIS
jgi:hypothetical protein